MQEIALKVIADIDTHYYYYSIFVLGMNFLMIIKLIKTKK